MSQTLALRLGPTRINSGILIFRHWQGKCSIITKGITFSSQGSAVSYFRKGESDYLEINRRGGSWRLPPLRSCLPPQFGKRVTLMMYIRLHCRFLKVRKEEKISC
jgi:hypothetical protein